MDDMRRLTEAASIALLALTVLSGCSDSASASETVYLHVFNAYPGTQSLSLYGPSGAVATDLPFGERTPSFREVDRNIGTDFELILDGAPTTFDIDIPLYDLYPNESATIFFKRRSGEDTIDDPLLLRHLQTGFNTKDQQCRLVYDNALSVNDDEIAVFNYIPLFKIRPTCTGYVDQIGSFKDSGQKITTKAGDKIEVGRPGLFDRIKSNPWFVPAETQDGDVLDVRNVRSGNCPAFDSEPGTNNKRDFRVAGDKTFDFVWAGGAREVDWVGGTFLAPSPTRQYMECIGWDPDKPPGKQKIESEQVLKCRAGQHTADLVKLNNEVIRYEFSTGIGLIDQNNGKSKKLSSKFCGFETTIISDFFNIFEDPGGGEKNLVKTTIKYPPSQYYFWVLYGRPVNPRIEKWGALSKGDGGGFIPIPSNQ